MKTVIEMAREATLLDSRDDWNSVPDEYQVAINAFAELVRADEREKWMERTAVLIRGEREACAQIAEDMNQAVLAMLNVTRQPIAIAAAIRARSNT